LVPFLLLKKILYKIVRYLFKNIIMKKVIRVTEKDIEKMIQKIIKEDVSWPWSKKEQPSDITPRGVKSTVYPDEQLKSVSDVKALPQQKNPLVDRKIDLDVMQEISDRLYGPDSEEYLKAILDLNSKFRKRSGKHGNQFLDPSIEAKRKEREREINQRIK
jgi:hypothetical protein